MEKRSATFGTRDQRNTAACLKLASHKQPRGRWWLHGISTTMGRTNGGGGGGESNEAGMDDGWGLKISSWLPLSKVAPQDGLDWSRRLLGALKTEGARGWKSGRKTSTASRGLAWTVPTGPSEAPVDLCLCQTALAVQPLKILGDERASPADPAVSRGCFALGCAIHCMAVRVCVSQTHPKEADDDGDGTSWSPFIPCMRPTARKNGQYMGSHKGYTCLHPVPRTMHASSL